jgi:hypothetical protein
MSVAKTFLNWFPVNDNPPVFDRPTYETQITEEDDRNLPKRVLQVIVELFGRPFSIKKVGLFHISTLLDVPESFSPGKFRLCRRFFELCVGVFRVGFVSIYLVHRCFFFFRSFWFFGFFFQFDLFF